MPTVHGVRLIHDDYDEEEETDATDNDHDNN